MTTQVLQQALEALEEIHHGNMTPMAEGNWNKAIESLRSALAQQGEQQPVAQKVDIPARSEVEFARLTGEIQRLAVSIWSSDYRSESPHWTVLPDAFGALSQISNMAAGMERKAAPAAHPDARKVIEELLYCVEAWERGCLHEDYRRDRDDAIQAGQEWLEENKP